jgi:hypothetical protein
MTDLYGIAGGSLVVLAVIVGVPYLVRRWRRISARVDAQMAAEVAQAFTDDALDEAAMWAALEREFGPATRRFTCQQCGYESPMRRTVGEALMDCAEHPHSTWRFSNRPTQEQP